MGWQADKRIIEAMNNRDPFDIAIFLCPRCGSTNYYNQGSWARCHVCKSTFYVLCDDEDFPADGRDVIYAADLEGLTLGDVLGE